MICLLFFTGVSCRCCGQVFATMPPEVTAQEICDVTGSLKDEFEYHPLSISHCETRKVIASHSITYCSGNSNQIISDIKCFAGFCSLIWSICGQAYLGHNLDDMTWSACIIITHAWYDHKGCFYAENEFSLIQDEKWKRQKKNSTHRLQAAGNDWS